MKKKVYIAPKTQVTILQQSICILAGSPGDTIHTDDPQTPGGAMSRQGREQLWDVWDDEENEEW